MAAAEAVRPAAAARPPATRRKGTTGELPQPSDSRAPVTLREKFGGLSGPGLCGGKLGQNFVCGGSTWGRDRMAVKAARRWAAVGNLRGNLDGLLEITSFSHLSGGRYQPAESVHSRFGVS